jgi:transcriptional regulator with XRE-family HTH domain
MQFIVVIFANMPEESNIIGGILREIRKEKKLSQEELADKASLHRTYIGMIENGERNITLIKFLDILKALDTTPLEFFKNYDNRLSAHLKEIN